MLNTFSVDLTVDFPLLKSLFSKGFLVVEKLKSNRKLSSKQLKKRLSKRMSKRMPALLEGGDEEDHSSN